MLMADHLILSSLQPPPFLIFSSSLHRRWRFPGGSRFSGFAELRFSSSQLQLANSTSPYQSSSSAPEKFDLVSTTQLDDGSHLFRFGDASEIETEAKLKKENAKLAEEANEVLSKQEMRDGLTLVDQDRDSELESPKKKSASSSIERGSEKEETGAAPSNLSNVIKIKDRKRVRSPTKKKKEPSVSVNVSPSEDKVEAKVASVSSVAEVIPTSFIEEKVVVSRESEPINENENTVESYPSQVKEKVSVNETKVASVSNLSSIVSVSEDISSSSIEEKVVVSRESEPISEKVEPLSSEVIEKGSVNDLGNSETKNGCVEVQARPTSSTSQHGSQSYDLEEVAHVSTIELDDNLDARDIPMKTFEAEENLVNEPTATDTVSPDELISASEATQQSVDKIAVIDTSEENLVVEPTDKAIVCPDELISASEGTHHSVDKFAVIDTPEVANEEENVASTIEDEIAVSDTDTDNGSLSKTVSDTEKEDLQCPAPETIDDTKSKDLQSPAPETASLESIEVASDREELVSKAFYLESGFASLQNQALAGREDAYFVSHNNWLGIADGVSHWSFEGTSKGMYAQELMCNCQKIISDETAKIVDPVQLLHRSVDETKSPGSSTALIARLDNNELHIANIGDSGFMVIRNRKVFHKSSPMFHHFCFPLQITKGYDVLKLAEVYHVNLEEDDVIITATDGLFDNLYEKEIVAMVCRLLEQSLEPQKVAELVAAKAQEVGQSKSERTPFADSAKEEGYVGYKGGKLDDVTVIVSIVKTVSI